MTDAECQALEERQATEREAKRQALMTEFERQTREFERQAKEK